MHPREARVPVSGRPGKMRGNDADPEEATPVDPQTVVVGAGVAGLVCARELARGSLSPVVLDRAQGVGGRCATRVIEGQPVDHGTIFLHGTDAEFVADLRAAAPPEQVLDWPRRVSGSGAPWLPDRQAPGGACIAYEPGIAVYPRHLARGLDVHLQTGLRALALREGHFELECERGRSWRASTVVLALPVAQALEALEGLRDVSEDVASVCELLRMVGSFPSLTLIAGYALEVEPPDWCVLYPDAPSAIELVSHDSSKRRSKRFHVLVVQARPGWSKAHLGESEPRWRAALLEELARAVGPWAAEPCWVETHVWHHALVDRGSALARPILLRLPGGARLGLAGEVFSPEAGVQAAWLSGRELARRLQREG